MEQWLKKMVVGEFSDGCWQLGCDDDTYGGWLG